MRTDRTDKLATQYVWIRCYNTQQNKIRPFRFFQDNEGSHDLLNTPYTVATTYILRNDDQNPVPDPDNIVYPHY